MEYIIKPYAQIKNNSSDSLIIPIDNNILPDSTKYLSNDINNIIKKLIKRENLKYARNIIFPLINLPYKNIIIIRYKAKDNLKTYRKTIINCADQLINMKSISVHFIFNIKLKQNILLLMQHTTKLFTSSIYQYNETLTKKINIPVISNITFFVSNASESLKNACKIGYAIGCGINVAKQLGNLPSNICTPNYLAKQAIILDKKYQNINTTILDKNAMQKLKMGALLSVTDGSNIAPKLIVIELNKTKQKKPLVLIGKGVTFDSGGISLKPSIRMDEMKYDMCGAASIFGTIYTLAKLNSDKYIIGIIPAVENMPSKNATKPGDVITSMSGKTIEILNTDAEGRLILCDAINYAVKFNPEIIIDVATLTGACIVALSSYASALYSNNNNILNNLHEAGIDTYDRVWPMPMWSEYSEQLESNFADIANIGGNGGGSITAACFLSKFVHNYPWAHLDIAGSAWNSNSMKSANGRPVSLLSQFILKFK